MLRMRRQRLREGWEFVQSHRVRYQMSRDGALTASARPSFLGSGQTGPRWGGQGGDALTVLPSCESPKGSDLSLQGK